MSKEKIEVEGGKVYGPYSSGIKAGGMIYLAGQIAPEAGDDIASQTGAVLTKIDALLAAAGTDRNSLVFAQVLLAEIDDFAAMNEVYGTWLAECENPPHEQPSAAMTCRVGRWWKSSSKRSPKTAAEVIHCPAHPTWMSRHKDCGPGHVFFGG